MRSFIQKFGDKHIWLILVILLSLSFRTATAQATNIKLSQKHLEKIEKTSSVEKKIIRYKRYFHRDSVRHMRALKRRWRNELDSMSKAFGAEESVQRKVKKSNAVTTMTEGANVVKEKSSSLPSVPAPMQQEVQKVNQYSDQLKQYQAEASNFNMDTIKNKLLGSGAAIVKERAETILPNENLQSFTGELGKAKSLEAQFSGYAKQASQLGDSTFVKEQAKKKAEELAMKYIEENPAVIEGVQKKIGLLMKKYSVVPNSNDLSSAIKRNSLKGKPLGERLVVATNFRLVTLDPVCIDFSPTLGYKFNAKFIAGLGANYRQTFSNDSIPSMSRAVFGYKSFASYEVLNSLYAYGEFERNRRGGINIETSERGLWHEALLLGIGRTVKIYKAAEMTVLVAYNVLHEERDPIYPRPLIVRVGVQTPLSLPKKLK